MSNRTPVIATIVEGHGEVKAVPVLLRRMAGDLGHHAVDVPNPWRLDRAKYESKLVATAQTVTARVGGEGGLLVILDADDDCPVELAGRHQETLSSEVAHCKVEVVVACREFEAWFLASHESLRGHRDVVSALTIDDPDVPRGAKELLAGSMSTKYMPTLHQPAFAARMDLRAAKSRSRSVRHLEGALGRLLTPGAVA